MKRPRTADSPYRPPAWARNGHVNTIAAYRAGVEPVQYRRERFETPDGDFFDVDHVDGPPDSPILVVLHGLEGSSDAPYVRAVMQQAHSRDWTGVAINNRSCSGEVNRRLTSYHAGFTDDLDQVFRAIAERMPNRPVLAVGFSLGGSQIGNWLARTTDAAELVDGAVLVSVPLVLAASCAHIDSGLRRLYAWRFLATLRPKVKKKRRQFDGDGDVIDMARRALRVGTIRGFDHHWTAPVHGFGDAATYYDVNHIAPRLAAIRVPTTVLHALDDPFVPPDAVPRDAFSDAQHVDLHQTQHGGHVGWHHSDPWLSRWIVERLQKRLSSRG